jgi:(S)-2-hydroxyglutarate dehydrogenase
VPNPALPFLGVHFTRTTSGQLWAGPNAILALAREGYRRGDASLTDLAGMLAWPGFWKMAARFWRVGMAEMLRDAFKAIYVRDLQKYIPTLASSDLVDGPSGVRAQTVTRSGALSDDFVIEHRPHVTHVLNAPSPAATSSLVLSRMIIDQVAGQYGRMGEGSD